jgi:UDPglucose--hexose-1-phosphate uridylyltransferase
VVCFTSDHTGSFAALSLEHARLVVDAWAHRTQALSQLDVVQQVFCFENRGQEIGVTLHHPHGQIYAYPFVPPTSARMLAAARRHREQTGDDLFAEVLAAELRAGTRVVWQSEHWAAFVPAAARWPVEVHLYPRRQVPDLAALDDAERDDLAASYLQLLRGLDGLFGVPLPYIAGWYQAPVREHRDLAWLHLRLFSIRRAPDKLKYLAGSESGMGAFINDITPEDMAARLRDVVESAPLGTLTTGPTEGHA